MALGVKGILSRVLICVFILAGLGGLVFVLTKDYFSPEARQLRKQMELVKEQEEAYKNDTFGGSTPEETLALFVDALKKGDTDLAARYFILDKQEEWREDLSRIKEKGLLSAMVGDLDTAQKGKDISENSSIFSIVNKNNEVITVINIARISSGRWKIMDF